MFGHQNDQSQDHDATIPESSIHGVLDDQAINSSQPGLANPSGDAGDQPAGGPAPGTQDWQHPGVPLDPQGQPQNQPPSPPTDAVSPVGGFPRSTAEQAVTNASSLPEPVFSEEDNGAVAAPQDDALTHELVDIKQHALTELSPLINELDLEPEERFRTLMMMIQASDDEHLVKAAYEAAHSIQDEKARARALLDIVNEVNYFTQQPEA